MRLPSPNHRTTRELLYLQDLGQVLTVNISRGSRKRNDLRYPEWVSESHLVASDSLWPRGLYNPWNSPCQNTPVGSRSLLQGIFPTQGLNVGLQNCRQILYQLSPEHSIFSKTCPPEKLSYQSHWGFIRALPAWEKKMPVRLPLTFHMRERKYPTPNYQQNLQKLLLGIKILMMEGHKN